MRLFWKYTNIWKLHGVSLQRFVKDHLDKAVCSGQVFKPPLQKVILTRTLRQRFFQSHKIVKNLWDGLPFFINKFLKPEKVVYSKCQNCSSINYFALKLADSGKFFFHAKYRILSVNQQRNVWEFIILSCKYELTVRIEVVLKEAILYRSSSEFFCNNCKFPI